MSMDQDDGRPFFRILGPVGVSRPGRPPDPPVRPQQHLVLAALLVDAGHAVPVDRLVDRVWGDNPPAQARRTLHTHVTRIRRMLSDETPLVRQDGGYRLVADSDRVDALLFRTLAERARHERQDAAEQARLWREALSLWRGEPLAGLAGEWAARTRERLAVARADAVVAWSEAELRQGRADEVIDPLIHLVQDYPLMEPATAALIRALAAAGRTSEALERYELTRRRLTEELGADPGAELTALHRELLAGPAEVTPPGAPVQLPVALRGFVGRRAELDQLDMLLTDDPGPPGTAVAVLSGMPGAGKSALAVHWGHRTRSQFPGGQFFVALRGFHPTAPPVAPADALAAMLGALGVSAAAMPSGVDERASLYRGLLADRRMLVLLDDAASVEQVRPLLPGGPGCLVLVTSRHALGGLVAGEDARPLPVDPLSEVEASGLLAARLGARRVAEAPDAVRTITELCAGLPLALAVAAAHAATRPRVSLPELAGELRAGRDTLDALAADDPAVDVRTVFSCSYRALTNGAARVFRLIALYPGRELSAPVVASLTGVPVTAARTRLGELVRANLAVEQGPGRWALHDLLRAYAMEMLARDEPEPERDAAFARLLDHHLHTANAADRLLDPHREELDPGLVAAGVTVQVPADEGTALAWFDREWPALADLVRRAADDGHDRHAWQLAWTLATFIRRHAAWTEWAAAQRTAVAAAGRLGDAWAEAYSRRLLGLALLRLGELDSAEAELRRAGAWFAELNDPAGQAHAYRGLGSVAYRRGDIPEALVRQQAALERFTAAGHRSGRANALNAVGWNLAALGRFDEALGYCVEALAPQQELRDRFGLANTWNSIGFIHFGAGRTDEAIAAYEQSVLLSRELGDRNGEADTQTMIGKVYRRAGRTVDAKRAMRRALELLRSMNPLEAKRLGVRLDADASDE